MRWVIIQTVQWFCNESSLALPLTLLSPISVGDNSFFFFLLAPDRNFGVILSPLSLISNPTANFLTSKYFTSRMWLLTTSTNTSLPQITPPLHPSTLRKTILHIAAQVSNRKSIHIKPLLKTLQWFSILLKAKAKFLHRNLDYDDQDHASPTTLPIWPPLCLTLLQQMLLYSSLITSASFHFRAFALPSAWNKFPADNPINHFFASFRSFLKCHLLKTANPYLHP